MIFKNEESHLKQNTVSFLQPRRIDWIEKGDFRRLLFADLRAPAGVEPCKRVHFQFHRPVGRHPGFKLNASSVWEPVERGEQW